MAGCNVLPRSMRRTPVNPPHFNTKNKRCHSQGIRRGCPKNLNVNTLYVELLKESFRRDGLCVERQVTRTKFHLLAKHLIDASADFFVREELPFVELLQAFCHLLAEPRVMVNVVFHKLFDVFLCAALILGSGPLHFSL